MNDDPPLLKGLIALWLFVLLVTISQINYVFSHAYQNNNLDITNLDPDSIVLASELPPVNRAGQAGKSEEKGFEAIEEYIQKYSERYSVSSSLVRCIIWFESSNNPDAVGSAGEQGLCQFKLSTWRSFRRQMGESEEASPFNPEEAVKTLSFALSKGLGYHWTTYGRCR